MVHQCVSEDFWFRTMPGIDVGAPPLPNEEVRMEFMRRYAEGSGKRLEALRTKDEGWWEGETQFFDVQRSRAWVMMRRIAHTPIIADSNWHYSGCSGGRSTVIMVQRRIREG
jgi:hypothetical protein